ncbi:hypothetical protein [Flavivirga jejuensis]|uniref:Acyl-CoA:6-aminopenicillanic acid acyl transferase n=1 Tax=Flavivirga jejuensis TaxID=870487 RepID=A0ABT8WT40_9FLAO|nr:hypothetical protein [Flavivirga jejuensis]MDO5976355.1 hypothetical protein [Flavivirga jejuensis]
MFSNIVSTNKQQKTLFKSTESILESFNLDGYEVVKIEKFQGMRGFLANSKQAKNYETGLPKTTYYVEGSTYQMGFLLGRLAPDMVNEMANEYIYNFIPAMINPEMDPRKSRKLCKLIWGFISKMTIKIDKKFPEDIPDLYKQEIQGLVDGSSLSGMKVTFNKLWNLNTAFDFILSYLYTGYGLTDLELYLKEKMPSFETNMLVPPIFCNGFSVFGNATLSGNDHFFGRDFMLSAANVLQNVATMIIYNPTNKFKDKPSVAFISVSAPGFVGSLTAMNNKGIGVGVNTVPAANCNRSRPGLNSIMLVRHCAQFATSAKDGVEMIRKSQRGVPWLYLIADGTNDKAVVVEAGKKEKRIDFFKYPPKKYKDILPKLEFIEANKSKPHQKDGMMERWSDFEYPNAYLNYNRKLFDFKNKKFETTMFSNNGFLDNDFRDLNCPDTYYFAPIRVLQKDVILVTNMYLIPEMRYCMMNKFTVNKIRKPKGVKTARNTYDDIQWRYDILNSQIQKNYGQIDFEKAIEILSFLNPDGEYSSYYAKNPKSIDGKTITIEGTMSVCDLKNKIIKSLFGYFKDPWIQLTLSNYIKN